MVSSVTLHPCPPILRWVLTIKNGSLLKMSKELSFACFYYISQSFIYAAIGDIGGRTLMPSSLNLCLLS